ncbi:uncharacterized protein C8A04DRAFT_8777 [Dichotomopilus funicola]|uniref:Uncharacterized protein n=1 Tax=Dichotomopilus funicola TaxID=1934379 RepID=A0AAN6VAT0_9PEZI|nr:hypothetical protein C8A04DRAFT_8777 [Dichotomopilus funicola]
MPDQQPPTTTPWHTGPRPPRPPLTTRLASLAHPRRLFSHSATRTLLVCTVLWLLAFAYGRVFLWRDPNSAYFRADDGRVYELGYSAVRQQQAREFVAGVSGGEKNGDGGEKPSKAGPSPALCAAFIAVRRQEVGEAARLYTADAIGSMLAGLDPRERAALTVKLLFANTEPARHPSWHAPWVDPLVDDADGYRGLTGLTTAGLRQAEADGDVALKGVHDYLYMLERCLEETEAPFVAVFQDDVVFAADWMARTLRGLQYLVRDHTQAAGDAPWLYLRLFYTETNLGWDAEGSWWYAHLPWTLAISSAGTAVLLLFIRTLSLCGRTSSTTSRHRRPDLPTITILSLLIAPAFTLLFFMTGKHNLPLPHYSLHHPSVPAPLSAPQSPLAAGVVPMDSNACCAQALVFHRPALEGLIANLRSRERGDVHTMVEEYCDAEGLKRFALREQVVQHVSFGRRAGQDDAGEKDKEAAADKVWAFWFETNQAEAVEKSHRRVLGEVDWGMLERLSGVMSNQ